MPDDLSVAHPHDLSVAHPHDLSVAHPHDLHFLLGRRSAKQRANHF